MADLRLRINELPEELNPAPIDYIAIDGPSTRRTSLQAAANAVRPYSTEAQAREGLNAGTTMTPQRVNQAIETLGGQRFATSQQGNKADSAVQPTLTITAGAGLTGGGSLAANRTIALSSTSLASLVLADSSVQPARQIIAGAGLAGGGSLAADRTISLSTSTVTSLGKADAAVQSVNGKAGNAVTLVKADVGLANVDNTSDLNKPVSTATQTALNGKATTAQGARADSALQAPGGASGQVLVKNSSADNDVSWETIAGATAVSYGPQDLTEPQKQQARQNIGSPSTATASASSNGLMSSTDKAKLDGVAAGAQVNTVTSVAGRTGAVTVTKSDVGLGSVDNTSDANKPISTATQTALNGKYSVNGGVLYGSIWSDIASNGPTALQAKSNANSSAAGSFNISGVIKLKIPRGGFGDGDGAYGSIQYEENVGTSNQLVFRINGFGTNRYWQMRDDGNAYSISGSWINSSDGRLKKEVAAIHDPIEALKKLFGCTWRRIDTNARGIGLIAQDAENAVPGSAQISEPQRVMPDGSVITDVLAIDTAGIGVAVLVEATKVMLTRIEELERQIAETTT